MHTSTNHTGTAPAVGRRRRPRRHHFRRIGYALSILLFCLAAVHLVPCLTGNAQDCVAEFERETDQTVRSDTQAPVITGVRDLEVYAGDAVSYREGVAVTDNSDPQPALTVDSSRVDLSTPGSYVVLYTATDASGNTAEIGASVTVLGKPEGHVDETVIYAAADEILADILTEDMPQREQVFAIYAWAKDLDYGGHSDRTDWKQTAYTMMNEGEGDCYGYFAVTKLFFERLGILNVDVQKQKASPDAADHFWSMVSVDGGQTYYHFDATPRVGQTEELCMVTDTFLDSFSGFHDGSHTRDKSLYPATPEGWS